MTQQGMNIYNTVSICKRVTKQVRIHFNVKLCNINEWFSRLYALYCPNKLECQTMLDHSEIHQSQFSCLSLNWNDSGWTGA